MLVAGVHRHVCHGVQFDHRFDDLHVFAGTARCGDDHPLAAAGTVSKIKMDQISSGIKNENETKTNLTLVLVF